MNHVRNAPALHRALSDLANEHTYLRGPHNSRWLPCGACSAVVAVPATRRPEADRYTHPVSTLCEDCARPQCPECGRRGRRTEGDFAECDSPDCSVGGWDVASGDIEPREPAMIVVTSYEAQSTELLQRGGAIVAVTGAMFAHGDCIPPEGDCATDWIAHDIVRHPMFAEVEPLAEAIAAVVLEAPCTVVLGRSPYGWDYSSDDERAGKRFADENGVPTPAGLAAMFAATDATIPPIRPELTEDDRRVVALAAADLPSSAWVDGRPVECSIGTVTVLGDGSAFFRGQCVQEPTR